MSITGAQPLVITGMHRSGTSLLAALLRSMGLALGGRDERRLTRLFEHKDFRRFHRRMLRAQGLLDTDWVLQKRIPVHEQYVPDAIALVRENARAEPWGWKDPRTTLFLDFWAELLPQARFLLVYRPPWEVIDSLFRRGDRPIRDQPRLALDVWLNYNFALLEFCQRAPERCLLVGIDAVIHSLRCDPDFLPRILRQHLGLDLARPAGNVYQQPRLHTGIAMTHFPAMLQHFHPPGWELYQALQRHATVPAAGYVPPGAPAEDPRATEEWLFQDWQQLRYLQGRLAQVGQQQNWLGNFLRKLRRFLQPSAHL